MSDSRSDSPSEGRSGRRLDRRQLLGALGGLGALGAAPLPVRGLLAGWLQPGAATLAAALPPAPAGAPGDEDFWSEVARAYTVDRSLINLNNGGVSPAPAEVQDAMARHLAYSHEAPAHHMWHVLEPQREGLRRRMAQAFGGTADELAFTRNASEGLQICQFGFDLEPGDEVLTTTQDYPRMVNTFRQRALREGIVLRQFDLPVPAEDDDEIVALFESHITPRTRLILMCHMINLTGQVLPVARVVAMARRHGLPVIVDGAHAFAHLDFRLDDLDCDYYATSLHKWLSAPHGTGLLYVRAERIPHLWPLMGAEEPRSGDIRKYEEIGTHPAANTLAVAEALVFHEALGHRRKFERLVWLRDAWARPLAAHDRVRLHTSLAPGRAGGLATVEVEGLEPGRLAGWLWKEHKILVTPITHADFRGVRVSPHVYTTPAEIERFVDAMEQAIREGLPA